MEQEGGVNSYQVQITHGTAATVTHPYLLFFCHLPYVYVTARHMDICDSLIHKNKIVGNEKEM